MNSHKNQSFEENAQYFSSYMNSIDNETSFIVNDAMRQHLHILDIQVDNKTRLAWRDIRIAYKNAARTAHSDKGGSDTDFKRVHEAYTAIEFMVSNRSQIDTSAYSTKTAEDEFWRKDDERRMEEFEQWWERVQASIKNRANIARMKAESARLAEHAARKLILNQRLLAYTKNLGKDREYISITKLNDRFGDFPGVDIREASCQNGVDWQNTCTPLMLAAGHVRAFVVRYLVKIREADVELKTQYVGENYISSTNYTALGLVIKRFREAHVFDAAFRLDCISIIRILLEALQKKGVQPCQEDGIALRQIHHAILEEIFNAILSRAHFLTDDLICAITLLYSVGGVECDKDAIRILERMVDRVANPDSLLTLLSLPFIYNLRSTLVEPDEEISGNAPAMPAIPTEVLRANTRTRSSNRDSLLNNDYITASAINSSATAKPSTQQKIMLYVSKEDGSDHQYVLECGILRELFGLDGWLNMRVSQEAHGLSHLPKIPYEELPKANAKHPHYKKLQEVRRLATEDHTIRREFLHRLLVFCRLQVCGLDSYEEIYGARLLDTELDKLRQEVKEELDDYRFRTDVSMLAEAGGVLALLAAGGILTGGLLNVVTLGLGMEVSVALLGSVGLFSAASGYRHSPDKVQMQNHRLVKHVKEILSNTQQKPKAPQKPLMHFYSRSLC